jgi:glycosyltransferase involved in cell wall biosynthesis
MKKLRNSKRSIKVKETKKAKEVDSKSIHTFVVMAYKDSPYLGECLESLKKQAKQMNKTCEKAQTVQLDLVQSDTGQSNRDGQSEIVIATSTPSKYIYNLASKYCVEVKVCQAGKGIAADWNFGLHCAKTKYVTLIHQDDIYMLDYARFCLQAAEKYPDSIITFTDYYELVDGKDRKNSPVLLVKKLIMTVFLTFTRSLKSRFWRKLLISVSSPICMPSVMYNIEILEDFEFSDDFSINMDWDAWYRMLEIKGRFVRVPKVLMKHRIHAESETSNGLRANKRQAEDLIMFKRFWPSWLARLIAKFYAISYKSNG